MSLADFVHFVGSGAYSDGDICALLSDLRACGSPVALAAEKRIFDAYERYVQLLARGYDFRLSADGISSAPAISAVRAALLV